MDKTTATNLLTTELAKHSHISIIREEWDKKNIITNSKYYTQIGNPFLLNYQYIDDSHDMMRYKDDTSRQAKGWCFLHDKRAEDGNHAYYSSLEKAVIDEEGCIRANYFFVRDIIIDKKEHTSGTLPHITHFFVTPYSIIGRKEETQCKELFYKDVHPEILCAIETLEIPHYIGIYEEYKNLKQDNPYLTNLKIRTLMTDIACHRFDGDGEIKKATLDKIQDIDILNLQFERLGLKSRISTTEHRKKKLIKKHSAYIHKKNLYELRDEIRSKYLSINETNRFAQLEDIRNKFLRKFYDFAFSLPYEDQNIEANKLILQANRTELDYTLILTKEYAKGKIKHFQEYFKCLDSEQQRTIVKALKTIPNNIPEHNSFLWNKGFKEVPMDHKELYYYNTDEFIEYFKSREPQTQKSILKDIMDYDYTNDTVAKWLDANERDLLREVSMDG